MGIFMKIPIISLPGTRAGALFHSTIAGPGIEGGGGAAKTVSIFSPPIESGERLMSECGSAGQDCAGAVSIASYWCGSVDETEAFIT